MTDVALPSSGTLCFSKTDTVEALWHASKCDMDHQPILLGTLKTKFAVIASEVTLCRLGAILMLLTSL